MQIRLKIYILLSAFFVSVCHLVGQDIHYSYYHFTPVNVNPANAGAFSGSYRINGIISVKQKQFDKGFETFSLSADAPIVRGLRKQDWVGIGIQADVIGSSAYTRPDTENPNAPPKGGLQNWTFIKVGAAYHLSLDKKQTNIITLGAQYSLGSRKYALLSQNDGRIFPQTKLPSPYILNYNQLAQGQEQSTSNPFKDLSVGFLYNARRKDADLRLGFAVEGLFTPNVSFIKNSSVDTLESKPRGLNIHGSYERQINKKLSITPGFYYYSLGPASALNVNGQVGYKLDPEKDLKLIGGLGLRNLRTGILFMGAEIKDIRVGVAIDLDINNAAIGSDGFGGFELGVTYIGKIYKKPKPKPVIFCPRL